MAASSNGHDTEDKQQQKKPAKPSATEEDKASLSSTAGLEAELARGLKLTQDLTAPPTPAGPAGPNKQGITVCFEADLQYDTTQVLDASGDAQPKPRQCHLPTCPLTESSPATTLSVCAQCKTVRYCGREHQVADWKHGHKHECAQWKALAEAAETMVDKKGIASLLVCKVRLHLGPFTLAHYDKQGRGFAFLQATSTAQELFIPRPIDAQGRARDRSVLIHFLTWGEFVSVVLEDDFEYTVARDALEEALKVYDPETEYLVLLKLRCGFLAVLRVPLVPNAGACRRLAEDYQWAEKTSVQLELD